MFSYTIYKKNSWHQNDASVYNKKTSEEIFARVGILSEAEIYRG